MPDPKMVTERAAVLREREAFREGANAVFCHFRIDAIESAYGIAWRGTTRVAEERYPLPTVTRARHVTAPSGRRYRVEDGIVHHMSHGIWGETVTVLLTDVTAVADLLANPTEEVNDV